MSRHPTARTRRRLGLVLGLLLLLAACTGDDDGATTTTSVTPTTESPAAGPLRLGAVGLGTLDPAEALVTSHAEMIAADLLYDGLAAFDPVAVEAVPALASDWEASDDRSAWTFTLRHDAVFSDGSAVTAEHVKSSLERVAALGDDSLAGVRLEVIEGYGPFVEGEADEISGIVVGDDATVEVTTVEPFADLPELLATPVFGVVPADADEEGFFEGPVGSGPFAFDGRAGGVVRLTRVDGSGAQVDEVELVEFESEAESYEAFTDGDLDWSLVPREEIEAAAEEHGDEQFTPFHAVLFYGINVGDPKYGDARFRQAIIRAVDREGLVEEIYVDTPVLNGMIPTGAPGAREDACGEPCSFDPDASRALLADVFGEGEVPEVQLDFFEGEREQAIAEAIAADLEEVGIPAALRPREFEEYREFVGSSEQEVFHFGWVGIAVTPDSYISPMFLSESGDNVTAFGSDLVDASIAAARAVADRDERTEAYQFIEQVVLGQVAIIPIADFRTHAVLADRVDGWVAQLDGTFVAEQVSLAG